MNKMKRLAIGGAAVGSLLVGGVLGTSMVGTATAADTTSTTVASTSVTSTVAPSTTNPQQAPLSKDPSQGGHLANGITETLLTGDDAAKAKAAALAAYPGATIQRVETDADGDAYEAHIVKSDGSLATVKFDSNFKVTSTETGAGGGGGPGIASPSASSASPSAAASSSETSA